MAAQPRRLRFSLLNLLLLMTIVVMAIVIFRQYQQLVGFRQQHADAGFLDVRDRSKTHAIFVPTYDEYTWRWRVWLPEGTNYQLAAVVNQVPSSGFPEADEGIILIDGPGGSGPTLGLEGGREHVVTMAIRKEDDRERLVYECSSDGARCFGRMSIDTSRRDWPFRGDYRTKNSVRMGSPTPGIQVVQPGGESCLLMRMRTSTGTLSSGGPRTDGLMIWLRPVR